MDGRLPLVSSSQLQLLLQVSGDPFSGPVWDSERWVQGGNRLWLLSSKASVATARVKSFDDAVNVVLQHDVPKTTSRTNVQGTTPDPLKSQMFGAAIARDVGLPSRSPLLVAAVHLLASCRDASDPYTTFQVNETRFEDACR